ncbi:MAG: homoserine O-succinyltransferase [Nitrosotalea sp.]
MVLVARFPVSCIHRHCPIYKTPWVLPRSADRSSDRRYLMHLGHPEYDAHRLAFEWERDRSLGRTDVEPPRNFDPGSPRAVWGSHCVTLFGQWLRSLRAPPRAGGLPAAQAEGDRQIM